MSVKISSFSCVTAFGRNPEDFWDACEKKQKRFADGLGVIPGSIHQEVEKEIRLKLQTPLFEGAIGNPLLMWTLDCIHRCMEQEGLTKIGPRDGIILATTTGLTSLWEEKLMDHFREKHLHNHIYQPLGSFALEIQNQLNHNGPVQIVSSACAAGTQAMGLARGWLRSQYVDRCFVVGAEQICQLTDRGFRSLSLVTGDDCFPFNEGYNNICLSEAAACICLKPAEFDQGVFLTGFGCTSDAFSMTAPRPDGSGPLGAMVAAIEDAGVHSDEIDWIHAHGTGSQQNDRAEAAALFKFNKRIPLTSTKGVHGHSLAASGVLETILCAMALGKQQVLPTAGADPKHFNVKICTEADKRPLRHILKNTLGFGGINSCLLFSLGQEGHA